MGQTGAAVTLSLDRIRSLRAQIKLDKAGLPPAELDSALAAAEALARLEAWLLTSPEAESFFCAPRDMDFPESGMFCQCRTGGSPYRGSGADLLTALVAALDEARA